MTFMLAAAVVGGAASIYGSNKAAKTAAGAADQATALQREMYQQGREDQMPWLAAGTNALTRMQDPAMAPTQWRDFTMADYHQDPGYSFRMSEGLKALDRTAAARGGLLSGATLKGAQRYGQDLASQEYGAAYNRYNTDQTNRLARGDMEYNRLASMAGLGQTTASGMAGQGQTAANAMGNGINAAGQATAAGQMGVGNSINNAINAGASSYQNQTNFNNWLRTQNSVTSASGLGDTYSWGRE